MNQLKRSLVCKKLSYDIKNNLIEKECYEYGYSSRYSSGYLARLLLSQFDDVNCDYKMGDALFNGYIKETNRFINVRFLEHGYNYTQYFSDSFKYLNECANYFKNYLIDKKLENELDCFHLLSELIRIDNLVAYCLDNKIDNVIYDLYLYFYEDKSNLASLFEKYINEYVFTNFNITLRYSISPIRELYSGVTNSEALERLEYYDLLRNDYTYEKIINEIMNESNVTNDCLIGKYSISYRTANYIKNEYDICNDSRVQYLKICEYIRNNNFMNNLQIIDTSFIMYYFPFSSQNSAIIISNKLVEIIIDKLLDRIRNDYYDEEIDYALLISNNTDENIKFRNYLHTISREKMNYEKKKNLILKFVEQVYEVNYEISICLYPLKKILK